MQENDVVLRVKDLSISFNTFAGRVNAIRGVDFELRRGETVAIVGESGSGKSVTVKSILGIRSKNEIVDRGEILFTYRAENGEDRTENLLKLSDRDMQKRIRGRHIALVFQDPLTSLNPTMTIGAQIAESVIKRRKASHAEAKKRTIELLEEVGIPNAAERYNNYPHQLSGGMRQRVVIAIALACEPDLLICDEPTTALDVTVQAKILDLIRDIQKRNHLTVIYITHDLGVINEMADDVAVMYCGQVVEKASARTIFSDCRMSHPYTEGLMFSIPRLDSKDKIEPIPGVVPHPLALPKGCKFAPRCKYCTKKCMEEEPELKDMGNGQLIRCFYPEKEVRRSAAHKEITVNH